MTAAHCVDKTDHGIHRSTRDWYAYVSPLGNQNGSPGVPGYPLSYSKTVRTFKHTFKSGLDIIPFIDAPTEPFEHRDSDIALIRLDERVPHPEGLHAVLPTPDACGTIMDGRLVGFSPLGYNGEGGVCFPESGGWRRRRGPTDVSWLRDEDVEDAAQYVHRFSAPSGQACTDFTGIGTGGDSGGSLYKANSGVLVGIDNEIALPGLLCGVISGDGPENDDDNGVTTYSDYHASATDHLFNITTIDRWVREKGFNPGAPGQGFLEDSWESRNDGFDDLDGDGIAAVHDNCTSVYNPEQLTTFDDPEPPVVAGDRPGDGIGLACDVCTGQQDSDAGVFGNINREVELAVADYPAEPTNPDDYNSPAAFQAARQTWLATFRPDACDPTPVPVVASLQEGIDLPIAFPAQPASCLGSCSLEIRNEIRVVGRLPADPLPANTSLTMGFRFCDCQLAPAGPGTHLEQGRRQCMQSPDTGCVYAGSAYADSAGAWKQITTPQTDNGWGGPGGAGVPNREWLGPAGFSVATRWNFTTLGAAVTTTASSQKVNGILWATYQLASQTIPGVSPTDLKDYGATLTSGNASWQWKVNGPREYHYSRDEAFCRECPMGLRHPYYQVSYPGDWRATIEAGSVSFPAPDAATLQHYEQVRTGAVRHVAASEDLRTLDRVFSNGATFVRSLGLEGQAVTRVLSTNQLDALPVRSAWSTAVAGPASASSRGYAFSATRQRLYVIGGQLLSGAPTNQAWTLDLGTGLWQSYTLPAGETVGGVLGASYRWQDGSVYFLDRSGGLLRLRRWNAARSLTTGVIQTLATFPSSWNPFSKVDLVQTPTGNMLLVAWSGTGSEKTRVGLVTVSKSSTVTLTKLVKSTVPIVAPPGAGRTGYTAVARAAIATTAPPPYAASVTYAGMSSFMATADLPTIHVH